MVIDHKGNVSQQIDIVIYDNWYTPFIFNQNGFKYIPAEGVYAVFEVKPDIGGTSAGKHNIVYAGEKVASVRRLMRTSTHMINSGQKYAPRPLTKLSEVFSAPIVHKKKIPSKSILKNFLDFIH